MFEVYDIALFSCARAFFLFSSSVYMTQYRDTTRLAGIGLEGGAGSAGSVKKEKKEKKPTTAGVVVQEKMSHCRRRQGKEYKMARAVKGRKESVQTGKGSERKMMDD